MAYWQKTPSCDSRSWSSSSAEQIVDKAKKKKKKKKNVCLKAAARVCFSVRVWFSKIHAFIYLFFFFFPCLIFFSFFMNQLVKIRWKDMTDSIKQFEQQTSLTPCSVLYLVYLKIQKWSVIFQTEQMCDWLKFETSLQKKKKKLKNKN